MPRILGVDIPKDKRLVVALTYLFGVGRKLSIKIISEAELNLDTRTKDLKEEGSSF